MDTNKNSYTIIYATLLVVIVAALLAFVSSALKERQQQNIDMEKQLSLLTSVGLAQGAGDASDKIAYVAEEYNKFITNSVVANYKGEIVEGNAFALDLKAQYDLMKQIAATEGEAKEALLAKLQLPVFICKLENGEQVYIFSCYGAGLWGPIWGYIGVKDDMNTIYGTVFAHKGETPGLGAEIASAKFMEQFKGKELFDGNTFTSVSVIKGGAPEGDTHGVDAISGGTITSNALDATIKQWFSYYLPYMEAVKAAKEAAALAAQAQAEAEAAAENAVENK